MLQRSTASLVGRPRPAPIQRPACSGRICNSNRSHYSGSAVLVRYLPNDHAVASEPALDEAEEVSQCPVLRSLNPIPKSAATWRDWPLQFSNPRAYYAASLAGRPLARSAFMSLPLVLAGNADVAKEVLFKEMAGDMTVGWPKSLELLLGREALANVSGAQHKRMRALVQPAFTPEAVARVIPTIQAIAERQLGEWAAETDAGAPVQGVRGLSFHAFEVIMQVALGRVTTKEHMTHMRSLFQTWSKGLFSMAPYDLPFLAFGHAMEARRQLVKLLEAAVARERAALAAGQAGKGTIGVLVAAEEGGVRLTDAQIVDNILLLLWAGHDTTASTLSGILFNLSAHPEAMRKLRQEQAEVAAAHGNALSARALRDMWYTEAVIRESMRLRPAVGGVFRKAARDTDVAEHAVPKDTRMNVPLGHLAMVDIRWIEQDDVNDFRPERMLTPEGKAQGWQMQFGAGNRVCVGAALSMTEMKVLLAVLGRSYVMTVDTDTTWGTLPLPFPKNGLPMWISHRTQ